MTTTTILVQVSVPFPVDDYNTLLIRSLTLTLLGLPTIHFRHSNQSDLLRWQIKADHSPASNPSVPSQWAQNKIYHRLRNPAPVASTVSSPITLPLAHWAGTLASFLFLKYAFSGYMCGCFPSCLQIATQTFAWLVHPSVSPQISLFRYAFPHMTDNYFVCMCVSLIFACLPTWRAISMRLPLSHSP